MLSITAFAAERPSFPILGSQSLPTSAASAVSPAPTPGNTKSIRLCADTPLFVALGTDPALVATVDDMHIPIGGEVVITCPAGVYVAAIQPPA